jgi:uncharacterized cupredoxin-like copper-binding protein
MKGTLTVGAAADNGGTGGQGTTGAASGGAAADQPVTADPAALKFQQETLEGQAGQAFTVNFTNPSPLQHSWVLVKPDTEAAVDAAATPKNGDWTGDPNVIAGSKVLNQNGAEAVQVPALEAGTYSYICTVPGHFPAGMKGTLTIK